MPVVEEINDEWVVFKAGAIELALHLIGEKYRKGREVGQVERSAQSPSLEQITRSNTKFVFAIEADLESYRETLVAAGVRVGAIKRYAGFSYRMFDGFDPEGNVFQVMQFDPAMT